MNSAAMHRLHRDLSTASLLLLLLLACAAAQAQQGNAPPAQAPVGQPPQSVTQPPEVAQIFPDQPGVLTPRGALTLEPSLQYANSTNNRVALVGFTIIPAITIGLINIQAVERDTWTAALTARYGLTNRLEIETRVPYLYREDSIITRPTATPSVTDSAFQADGNGIGDVEFALRYQLNRGGADSAFYVATLRAKSRSGTGPFEVDIDPTTNLERELPTGSGFWAVQPQLTWLLPSDPAVLFGSVSYLYNFKRDVGRGFGTVDPGNILGFNIGMGLSLNEKFSFSVGYDHSSIAPPDQEGDFTSQLAVATTVQVGTLLIGGSYQLNKSSLLNVTVGVGVTGAAPDLQLTVRLPYTTLN